MEEQSEGRAVEVMKLTKLNDSFTDRIKSLEDELKEVRRSQSSSPGNSLTVTLTQACLSLNNRISNPDLRVFNVLHC